VQILVTGGAGFIGSHLCDRLIRARHQVVAIDNLLLGRRENLQQLAGNSAFTLVEADVTDQAVLDDMFAEHSFDVVFHMAANSDIARSHADPDTDFTNTLRTTWAVLEAMRKAETRQIVFASTSAIYGEAPGDLREDHGPLVPISHYGAAKLASEAFISSFVANYGMKAWITRFPNVVGDRATHGAIFDFVAKLRRTPNRLEVLGDGSQVKPYLHVSDLVEAMLVTWARSDAPVNIFNVGGTTRCTVRRMAEIVVEESGRAIEIGFTGGDRGWIGDVPSVAYDTTAVRGLGWEPRLDSEAAVRATARALFDAEAA
jgi:UDP-glucose 4-epimerase